MNFRTNMTETKSKLFYDTHAKIYEMMMQTIRYHSTVQKLLLSLISSNEISHAPHILDLGCGTGLLSEMLLQRYPSASLTGFDFSKEMLKIYKERFPKATVIVGDYHNEKTFTQESSFFDLIITSGSLSEYSDLSKTLPWIYRILKPKGIFINIGVHRNMIGLMSSHIWHYIQVPGERRFMDECKKFSFQKVEALPVPWSLFPLNLCRYAVKVTK
ncbi:MAG: hypothetical protein A2Z91_01050 [Deltaproteobacteria bacterium GWA2_38_16]|nr:MAG: hypothetical protein A2Z91_01050 [Deltaproteobacteria bacterium GWA2_38_16]OGQ02970.1 MAG: hypothetical protein A3D19_00980 [Deltaproteobacteria bacterium RIFCSPHIGHO2_02_FULL_38_15]OGQ34513.1 MAG: hypothetical protein A3A72_05120 [Deltaproteobacteria bacterium RIFCSPLOWO2_01_FULL_38_9]